LLRQLARVDPRLEPGLDLGLDPAKAPGAEPHPLREGALGLKPAELVLGQPHVAASAQILAGKDHRVTCHKDGYNHTAASISSGSATVVVF
jgi:uncharacterized Zn-binding protein involved in type VI secretion